MLVMGTQRKKDSLNYKEHPHSLSREAEQWGQQMCYLRHNRSIQSAPEAEALKPNAQDRILNLRTVITCILWVVQTEVLSLRSPQLGSLILSQLKS